MNNLRQLHIIRGFAALYVAIGHSKVVFWSGGQEYIKRYPIDTWSVLDYLVFSIDLMSSSAQEFVIVFFILSGFFIAYSFEKNKWQVKDFLINRVVRIYPPYLFSLLLGILVFVYIANYNPALFNSASISPTLELMASAYEHMDLTAFFKSLFYLPHYEYMAGNLSYWSLMPEWIFYLTVPFLLKAKRWPLLIFTIAYFINAFFLISSHNALIAFLFEFGFYFFFGIEIYRYINRSDWQSKMPSKFISYAVVTSLLLATIALGILCDKGYISFDATSVLSACVLCMFSILTLLEYPIKGVFYRMGVFLGDISYTLYVCHLPIYYFAYAIITKQVERLVFYERIYWLIIPLAIAISYLAYLLVEKRTLVFIKKLKANRRILV